MSLKAQQYSVQHFIVSHGLKQSDANQIIQDNCHHNCPGHFNGIDSQQPFVENSVLHGFYRAPNYDKKINILAVISGDRFKILIKGNGLGITADNLSETGMGIKITKERFALPEKNAQVQIESYIDKYYHGTTITIDIPLKIKKD